jgi:hypothetical protein
VHDFNADGWPDILVIGFPGADVSWYANPGPKGGMWRRNVAFLPVDNESPTFCQLFKDGPPVLLCMSGGKLGYATWDPKEPTRLDVPRHFPRDELAAVHPRTRLG